MNRPAGRPRRAGRGAGLIAAALLVVAGEAAGQDRDASECPWAGPEPVGIGIERLRCVGGECEINVVAEDGRPEHRFTTEPRIDRLHPWAGEALRAGDVIVAVDGIPITARAGGRRLARLGAGRDVTLSLRREGRYVDVVLRPEPGCPISGLAVRRPAAEEDGS